MILFFYLAIVFSITRSDSRNDNNVCIENYNTDNLIPRGFPYQYYENEILTSQQVKLRINTIYLSLMINITVVFSFLSISDSFNCLNEVNCQSITRNKSNYNTEKILLQTRGGSDLIEFISRIIFLYTLSQSVSSTESFKPYVKNPVYQDAYIHQKPAISTKLKANPVDLNNNQQSDVSMDKLCKSISGEYNEFQNKYLKDSNFKRFDTKNYSVERFKKLAKNPRSTTNEFDRGSIDEARAITQAELEKLITKPIRPTRETAKMVDLDFEINGPGKYTWCDVKHPVGSHILKDQNRTIGIDKMAYSVGEKIVKQKSRFVGRPNGPQSAKNVLHLVDLSYVPSSEKSIVRKNIIQGALDAGSADGIKFLNDK